MRHIRSLLLAFLLTSGPALSAWARPLAWVTNTEADTVSVVDTATGTVAATIAVGDHPLGVAPHPDGSRAYVANRDSDDVSILDATSLSVATTVSIGDGPVGIALDPLGLAAFVTTANDHRLSILETASGVVTGSLAVGTTPVGVAVHPDGREVYVANLSSHDVSVVDPATSSVTATIPVGQHPLSVTVDAIGARLYVVNLGSSSVSVVDTSSRAVIATVPVAAQPRMLALRPDGGTGFLSHLGSAAISVIDTASLSVVGSVDAGAFPGGVDVHPDGSTLYVANDQEGSLSVIDASTLAVRQTISVGAGATAFGRFVGPLTGSWETRAPIPTPRQEVGVGIVDGKIYVVGGLDGNGVTVNTVERYDPARDVWETGPPVLAPTPVNHVGVAGLDGKLWVVGGLGPAPTLTPVSDRVYAFDPATNQWSEKAPLPRGRGAMGLAVLDGKLYAAGGATDPNLPDFRQDLFSVYDPETDQWTDLPHLPTPRNHVTAVGVAGKIYTFGGRDPAIVNVTEIFDPVFGNWSAGAPTPIPRSGSAAVLLQDKVYVLGGEGNEDEPDGTFDDVHEYDPATDAWRVQAPMPEGRHGIGAAAYLNRIFVPGGGPIEGFSVTARNDAFTPDELAGPDHLSTLVEVEDELGRPMQTIHAAVLPDGRVWMSALSMLLEPTPAWDLALPQKIVQDYNVAPLPGAYPGTPYQGLNVFDTLACSGHVLTEDGDLFVAGGTREFHDGPILDPSNVVITLGLPHALTFHPDDDAWTLLPPMIGAGGQGSTLLGDRWYPATTRLADGRILVTGGQDVVGASQNLSVERFDLTAQSFDLLSLHEETPPEVFNKDYTHVFQLPDSIGDFDVLMVGEAGTPVLMSTEGSQRWQVRSSSPRPGAPPGSTPNKETSSALLPLRLAPPGYTNGSVVMVGGDHDTVHESSIDVYDPIADAWLPSIDMGVDRHHASAILLPDSRVLVIAGHNDHGSEGTGIIQYLDPLNGFSLGRSNVELPEIRGYHTMSVLLPDGRIFLGGGTDDGNPGQEKPNFRYFYPDYMFESRPTILGGAFDVPLDALFWVLTESTTPVSEFVLMAPGAQTHSFDQGQRLVELEQITSVHAGGGVLHVLRAPPTAELAPPGPYMLFALDATRVPSEAVWVELGR